MPGDGLPPGPGPSSIAQRSRTPAGDQGHPLPRPLSRERERGASIRGAVGTAGLCCRRSACRAIAQRSCAPTASVAWMQRSGIRGDGATGFPVFFAALHTGYHLFRARGRGNGRSCGRRGPCPRPQRCRRCSPGRFATTQHGGRGHGPRLLVMPAPVWPRRAANIAPARLRYHPALEHRRRAAATPCPRHRTGRRIRGRSAKLTILQ